MSLLAANFCDRNADFEDPLTPVTVIVQSFGLGQWLKLQLAESQGVAANVDCVLPASFLWRLYQYLLPDSSRLQGSPFDPDPLTWRIMRILRENPGLSGAVNNYLKGTGDGDLRLQQLAHELALLLDEYLMYRPQWMLQWETGGRETLGHEQWQARLWQLILSDLPDVRHLHRASLHQQTLTSLAAGASDLPWQRLSVFGLSNMPPLQLQTFEALGQLIDIDIYFMNPCAHYWGDLVSEKDRARRSIRARIGKDGELAEEDYLNVGNPLLSSLGKQGREYMELLLESVATATEEMFIEYPEQTRLAYVKNDVLNLTMGGAFAEDEIPERNRLNDDSIQVHACHSRLREVEVLQDVILRALSDRPDLAPSDIIVMVPDISQYAPFIQSVFSNSLPYRIADQGSLHSSELLNIFLWLLQLPDARITASDILDLLEATPVRQRFGLSAENLETIGHWIAESGIRWELSGRTKADRWDVPAEDQNTWQFGFKRLFLGFARARQQGLWEQTLPVEISPSESNLLGTLAHVVSFVGELREQLSESRPMAEWQQLLTSLTSELFRPSDDEALALDTLLQCMDQLVAHAAAANYQAPLSHRALRHALQQKLSTGGGHPSFLSGNLTFATLVPMRSIPFKMVCLLGINDGEYPRDIRPHSFDLISAPQARPEKGDRSRKQDDRYLFLEALLSASDIFHVSYIGRGVRDNKEKPPSAILGEFIDYLKKVFDGFVVTEHALQPFHPRYYSTEAQELSFDSRWHEAVQSGQPDQGFVRAPLPADPSLACTSLQQLINFFRHPARFFLQERLGVYLDQETVELRDTESFDLSGLERFDLADRALTELLLGRDIEIFRQQELATGLLLAGEPGHQQFARELDRAQLIHEALSPLMTSGARIQTGTIDIAGQQLFCHLPNLFDNQALHWRVGDLKAPQLIAAWIEHLAANLLAKNVTTIYVSRGKDDTPAQLCLASVAEQDARLYLEQLLQIYHAGICTPVFLPPTAACEFVELSLTKAPDEALSTAIQTWMKDDYQASDRHWNRLFRSTTAFDDTFCNNAQIVWRPLLGARTDG